MPHRGWVWGVWTSSQKTFPVHPWNKCAKICRRQKQDEAIASSCLILATPLETVADLARRGATLDRHTQQKICAQAETGRRTVRRSYVVLVG